MSVKIFQDHEIKRYKNNKILPNVLNLIYVPNEQNKQGNNYREIGLTRKPFIYSVNVPKLSISKYPFDLQDHNVVT